ncbi:CehA/McbA family metallohydrolase [Clostridium gasigenes]|uniref:CehA/McbA family metallohydrolase n=1 Tax=Clostridium gasigenes TaxID=94869 RepID=UPI001C0BE082|nr:CehA/McbA family metallohydrolase [Clostridium gasigenes]MBU3135508.1 CehA/McbA family metallohydrolase [Clostridium gasigenes]
MNNWIPYELHTHTNHSDGKHTFYELALSAKKIGLGGFAMTDHNTISTFKYINDVSNSLDISIVRGLEWTTFWGHILLVGIKEYVEWTDITLENFNKKLLDARGKSELLGVAHPFRLGGAIATGCYCEYEIDDWDIIDYIEVWSGMLPSEKYMNKRAFALWTDLLNKGHRISAVSGRDWHKSTEYDKYIAATYLNIDGYNTPDNAIKAIKAGEIVVGFGYVIFAKLNYEDKEYNIGSIISKSNEISAEIKLNINKSGIKDVGKINRENLIIKIYSNLGELISYKTNKDLCSIIIEDIRDITWVRSELYEVSEVERLISFTNPIYFN